MPASSSQVITNSALSITLTIYQLTVLLVSSYIKNQPLSHWGSIWLFGNDVSAAQTSIFHHLVPKELSKSLGSGDGGRFLVTIFLKFPAHRSVLCNQLKQLRVRHVSSLAVQDIQPVVCNLGSDGQFIVLATNVS